MYPERVRECRLLDLIHVCRNMRPDEVEQTLAFGYREQYDPEATAAALYSSPGPKVTIVGKDGMPILCGGAMEIGPGTMQGWQVATMDGWEQDWRLITRVTRWFMGEMFASGTRRLQIIALVSRVNACAWYKKGLKMTAEGVTRGYGRNGEDALTFARLRTDA